MEKLKTYRGEKINDENKVIKFYEEKTNMDFDKWRYLKAIDILDPMGEEIKWYINGEVQLGNY